jgi:hypothetical protein
VVGDQTLPIGPSTAGNVGSDSVLAIEKLDKSLLDRRFFWCSWGCDGSSPEYAPGRSLDTTTNDAQSSSSHGTLSERINSHSLLDYS